MTADTDAYSTTAPATHEDADSQEWQDYHKQAREREKLVERIVKDRKNLIEGLRGNLYKFLGEAPPIITVSEAQDILAEFDARVLKNEGVSFPMTWL